MKQAYRTCLPAATLVASALVAGAAFGQGWVPQRNVELVVPASAGGSLDATARTVHRLWDELKLLPVTSTVVNRAGGGHAIAYTYVSQKTGDPHTLGIATSVLLTGHIGGRIALTYSDVTPIAFLLTEYIAFAVRADSPIKNGRDFLEALKSNPGALSVALGSALGGTHHIAIGLPFQAAGVDAKQVKMAAFNSSSEAFTALLGGHVNVAVGGTINAAPHVDGGKLRVIALSSPRRIGGVLAAAPTWEEQGIKGTLGSWRSVFAARGITPEQVAYWEGVLRRVVESEDFRRAAEKNQWDATFRGSADTRRFMEAEYAQLKGVMAYLGLIK